MRRIKPCWKSPSLAAGRQSEKTGLTARQESAKASAVCVWAWGSSLPTGRRYLAGSPCDVPSVWEPAGKSRLPAESITLLSTVSAKTATVDGRNGKDGADRVVLVQEPSLSRRRTFLKNTLEAQISQNETVSLQERAHHHFRHLQGRIHRSLHRLVPRPSEVDREKLQRTMMT